jgi:cell wall-associated NlpC family hydrolase
LTTREELVAEARRWIGTRWQHQGRTLGKGVDCAGVLTQTVRAVGPVQAEVIDAIEREVSGYSRDPSAVLQKMCDAYMRRIPSSEARAGDIALIRFQVKPQHLAIISEQCGVPYLIHSLVMARKVVEQRLDSVWRSRVVNFYTVF